MRYEPANRHNPGLDYLITNSGAVGRQILKFGRMLFLVHEVIRPNHPAGCAGPWQAKSSPWLAPVRWTGSLIIFLFTYYVGGSLTRSDQQTLAQLNGLGKDGAHRLTLLNALLFGIPTAGYYFLVGEGFRLLGGLHDAAALPSLLARNSALLIGAVSLAVDLFRAVDAAWNRRCWAPFGFFPFVINLPTYIKKLAQTVR